MKSPGLVPAFTKHCLLKRFYVLQILLEDFIGASGKGVRNIACLEIINLHVWLM